MCVYIHYKNNHILVIINNILAAESPRWSSTHANGACLHSCCSLLLLPDRMQSNANMRWPAAGSGEYEDHDDDDENVCSINKHPGICNIAPTHTQTKTLNRVEPAMITGEQTNERILLAFRFLIPSVFSIQFAMLLCYILHGGGEHSF